MDQQPFHITFYSYRGGSERTSALVNVGFELARRGRKVLLVDFDLESPALAVLPPIRTEQPHSGLVEYVTEYLDTNQSPPISDYLYHAVSLGKKGGEVWVMPAGREDSDYWEALGRLDWQALYLLHMGYVFFEDTRRNGSKQSSLTTSSSTRLPESTISRGFARVNSRTWSQSCLDWTAQTRLSCDGFAQTYRTNDIREDGIFLCRASWPLCRTRPMRSRAC